MKDCEATSGTYYKFFNLIGGFRITMSFAILGVSANVVHYWKEK